MIIRLNETVKISEFAEIMLLGIKDKSNYYKVEFTFSKEALVGFATNLLWMYEDIDSKKRLHVHVDSLLGDVPANQSLGYFLTPQSPSMVVNVNGIDSSNVLVDKVSEYKEVFIKYKFIKVFEVKEPAINESIEEYELGCKNIVRIRILNHDDIDVTNNRMQIVFNISYNGMKDFSNMLLILANNYEYNQEYVLAHANQREKQYNMGVLFSENSCEVILKCNDLGCVYDYDSHFGLIK